MKFPLFKFEFLSLPKIPRCRYPGGRFFWTHFLWIHFWISRFWGSFCGSPDFVDPYILRSISGSSDFDSVLEQARKIQITIGILVSKGSPKSIKIVESRNRSQNMRIQQNLETHKMIPKIERSKNGIPKNGSKKIDRQDTCIWIDIFVTVDFKFKFLSLPQTPKYIINRIIITFILKVKLKYYY